jgi:hypothetical protein
MTIQQTIEIPVDRRVHFDLPRDIPAGAAKLKLIITPFRVPRSEAKPQSGFQKHFDEFYGCLKQSPAFEGDSAEIIRKMRDEW